MRAALEKMQLQHQLAQNQQYIDFMTQKYQTLRQYQHDFKKHLANRVKHRMMAAVVSQNCCRWFQEKGCLKFAAISARFQKTFGVYTAIGTAKRSK